MRAMVLMSGWIQTKIMELTQKQFEQYQSNPLVLSVVPLPGVSELEDKTICRTEDCNNFVSEGHLFCDSCLENIRIEQMETSLEARCD